MTAIARDPLPEHYPVANASWEEKLSWLEAAPLPYERIRLAAPWLTTNMQVRWYLDGLQEALANPDACERLAQFIALSPHANEEE